MKKIFVCMSFYCIFLLTGLSLVSCATTSNTAAASGEETQAQTGENPAETLSENSPLNDKVSEAELVVPEEPAEAGDSERIPEDEVDELNSLLETRPLPEKITDSEIGIPEESLSDNEIPDEKTSALAPQEIQSGKESAGSEENSSPEENTESVSAPAETKSPAAEIKNNSGSVDSAAAMDEKTPAQNGSDLNTDLNLNNTNLDNTTENKGNSEKTENADASAGEEIPLETEEPAKEDPPLPSRSMTVKNNQFVDIVYPGTGWIYLGEVDRGGNFIFQGRKLGKGETTFTLRSKKSGKALLHFYKNDGLTGNYIDDYIEINIGDQNATDAVHVTAPAYADVVPPKYERTQTAENTVPDAGKNRAPAETNTAEKNDAGGRALSQSENGALSPASGGGQKDISSAEPNEKVQTVIQTSGSEENKSDSKKKTSVAASPDVSAKKPADSGSSSGNAGLSGAAAGVGRSGNLLEQAQKAYDEKRYADALELVQQFFDVATEDFDAGLYLEGLILEAKSDVRNIKSAIDAYDTLIKNWPQSNYWRRANERSIYLKRFYIDIR